MTSDVLRVATEARSRSLGPFNPAFNIHKLLLENLEKFLPEDAHVRVSGKLHVSLTRCYDGKNVIVSQFDSRNELIQALLASAFIPIFSGLIPPKYKGVRYMDGGYSDNLPMLDDFTITVSPFCGESDICPRDNSSQLFHINIANTSIELSRHNVYRILRILFPPRTEVLSNMCKQGFDDALRFLHRNDLINCTRCLAVQSTYIMTNVKTSSTSQANDHHDKDEEYSNFDPECNECIKHREEALVSKMPDTVMNIFQEAIDSANSGVLNWLYKHRGMKLLSIMTLPYTLPADVIYATFKKFGFFQKTAQKKDELEISTPTFYKRISDINLMIIAGGQIENHIFCRGHASSRLNCLKNAVPNFTLTDRLISLSPKIFFSMWNISKFFLDQIMAILNTLNSTRYRNIDGKIICKLAVTEYASNDEVECQDNENNSVNLNFTLNLDDSDLLEKNPARKFSTNKILHRNQSFTSSTTSTSLSATTNDNDTFDHILHVTSQHEAVMTYYYLDENNKVNVTEIFDVTESDSPIVQTKQEKELNGNLEFDEDWGELEIKCLSRSSLGGSDSLELFENDTSNIFSDPESEWQYRVEEPEDEIGQCSVHLNREIDQNGQNLGGDGGDVGGSGGTGGKDLRPESEQPNEHQA